MSRFFLINEPLRPLSAGFSPRVLPRAASAKAWKWLECLEAIYTKDVWYLHVISLCYLSLLSPDHLFKLKVFLWLSWWLSLLDFSSCLCHLFPQDLSLAHISGKGSPEAPRKDPGGMQWRLFQGFAYLACTLSTGGGSFFQNGNTVWLHCRPWDSNLIHRKSLWSGIFSELPASLSLLPPDPSQPLTIITSSFFKS